MTQEVSKYSVNELADFIKSAKKSLKGIENKSYRTTCRFKFNPTSYDNNGIPIDTVTDVSLLLNIAAFLIEKEEYYQKAVEHFKLDTPDFEIPVFKWNGYSKNDWLEDIELRLQLIYQKEKIDLLDEAEAELKQLQTRTDRLEALASRLNFTK